MDDKETEPQATESRNDVTGTLSIVATLVGCAILLYCIIRMRTGIYESEIIPQLVVPGAIGAGLAYLGYRGLGGGKKGDKP
ncbi:MAG: hypothetical protein JWN00_5620 [Actinomycetia bacterium]|jgi:hypothetical protein|nr:hypothetical protein [Actinomycetes bacterium]